MRAVVLMVVLASLTLAMQATIAVPLNTNPIDELYITVEAINTYSTTVTVPITITGRTVMSSTATITVTPQTTTTWTTTITSPQLGITHVYTMSVPFTATLPTLYLTITVSAWHNVFLGFDDHDTVTLATEAEHYWTSWYYSYWLPTIITTTYTGTDTYPMAIYHTGKLISGTVVATAMVPWSVAPYTVTVTYGNVVVPTSTVTITSTVTKTYTTTTTYVTTVTEPVTTTVTTTQLVPTTVTSTYTYTTTVYQSGTPVTVTSTQTVTIPTTTTVTRTYTTTNYITYTTTVTDFITSVITTTETITKTLYSTISNTTTIITVSPVTLTKTVTSTTTQLVETTKVIAAGIPAPALFALVGGALLGRKKRK